MNRLVSRRTSGLGAQGSIWGSRLKAQGEGCCLQPRAYSLQPRGSLQRCVARRHTRGQAMAEYAILMGVAVAAIVGMQLYAKRGIQAGLQMAADQIGDQLNGMRYESGDRSNQVVAAGATLTKQAGTTSNVDRSLTAGTTLSGGRESAVARDTVTTTGALVKNNQTDVSYYSEVIAQMK